MKSQRLEIAMGNFKLGGISLVKKYTFAAKLDLGQSEQYLSRSGPTGGWGGEGIINSP